MTNTPLLSFLPVVHTFPSRAIYKKTINKTHPSARGSAESWLDWTLSFCRSLRKPISGGSPSSLFSSRSSTRSFLKLRMVEGILCQQNI